MTREEKIEAIYKEMANKELTLGCKVKIKYDNISYGEALEEIRNPVEEILTVSLGGIAEKDNIEIEKYQILSADSSGYIEDIDTYIEIIGHPVMIGTIFERYSSNRGFINSQFILALVDKWTGYDRSIEEQSDESIDFIYSLIKK